MSELHQPIDPNKGLISRATVLTDKNGQILQVDDEGMVLFGYGRNELQKKHVQVLVSKTNRQDLTNALIQVGVRYQTQIIDTIAVTKTYKEFFAEISISLMELENNTIYVCTFQDTSLNKMLASAHQSEDSMTRAMLDASLDCIVSIDTDGNFIEFNRAAERTFGYFREDVIGKPMADFIMPDSFRDAHHNGLTRYLSTHQAKVLNQRLELVARRADGSEFPMEITISPINSKDGSLIFTAYLRDISKEHKLRSRWERLLRFEEVNREIIRLFLQLDNLDTVVNEVLAMTGILLDVSRSYVFRFRENERILDNTHEWCAVDVEPQIDNLKGLPFDELFPSFFPLIAEKELIAPYHISALPEDLQAILEPQDIKTVLWIPIYFNQRIEGFIGYDEIRESRNWLPEEITMARMIAESYARALEREQTAKMLVRARDNALHTAEVRSQFVANMSHEIRTPMTGILGMLELLLETDLDETQQDFASDAFISSQRLLAIINSILDFSKLDAGQIILEASPIDLTAIATEVKMTLAPQLKGKSVEIRLDIDPDIPYRVYGDATRIRQVLMNLAGNAIKFTREGQVTIRIKLLYGDSKTSRIRFSVQDTGIGIEKNKVTQIFDSFVQADGTTTRKYGGTGLGLSISKQLVELMGGVISVDSELNVGSTFEFLLTLSIAKVNSNQDDKLTVFAELRVAVVDSNRTARYVLVQHLENWGVDIIEFDNATELETVMEQQRAAFDVIFQRYTKTDVPNPKSNPNIVYVVEDDTAKPQNKQYIRHPIDASVLYNTLTGFTAKQDEGDDDIAIVDHDNIIMGRILVADDYVDNREIIRSALSIMPVEVDFVENGQQVLEKLDQKDYDLILMDIQMPVMDGIEATEQIRQSSAIYRDIPILALTASVMRHQKEHYIRIGINKVISKPFSIQELRNIVTNWLQETSE